MYKPKRIKWLEIVDLPNKLVTANLLPFALDVLRLAIATTFSSTSLAPFMLTYLAFFLISSLVLGLLHQLEIF